MQLRLRLSEAITPAQLRAVHGLWRRWAKQLSLAPARDRELRHYYISLFSNGRAVQSNQLTKMDAVYVISWLERLSGVRSQDLDRAAGTAGKQGFPERSRVRPDSAAWRALWACTRALGWNRAALENFIRRHYSNHGLTSLDDLRTMADVNRVLWGLKAILRRRPAETVAKKKAA